MYHSFNKFLYIGQDRNFLTPYYIIIRKWRYNLICEMPDYKYYRKMRYAKIRLTVRRIIEGRVGKYHVSQRVVLHNIDEDAFARRKNWQGQNTH